MESSTPDPGSRRAGSPRAELAREKDYVRKIEKRFLALRESGLILSTRDFEIVHDWFERGVPVELVIGTLEEVYAKTAERSEGRRIQSIAYCRKAVERAWEERRAALLGTPAPAARSSRPSGAAFTGEQIASHLASVAEKTRAAAAGVAVAGEDRGRGGPDAPGAADDAGRPDHGSTERARTVFLEVAGRLDQLAASFSATPAGELPALEAELVALEERAVAAGRDALPASELDAIGEKTEQDFAAVSSRMSAKARAATLRRAVDAAVRLRLTLPRYSLFTMTR